MMRAAILTLLLAAATVSAQSQGHYQEFGDARGFLNVVPPGSDGVLNATEAVQAQGGTFPPHFMDQLSLYANIVYNAPGLTDDRLLEFYRSEEHTSELQSPQ